MAACSRRGRCAMPASMGMPGRGMMFVGENGVQVSAFYGGTPSVQDHTSPRPGQRIQGFPAAGSCRRAKFRDFKQPDPSLPRCERADHYTEWIQACKAGKKSIMPIELACDFTEFALLGSATLRRYSAPPPGTAPETAWGGSGRSDSAVVWVEATGGGHVVAPGARPQAGIRTGEVYYRSSKVLTVGLEGHAVHQRRAGQRLRGHALPQGVGLQSLGNETNGEFL